MEENSGKIGRIARLSHRADTDLRAIYIYSAQQWGEEQAEDYVLFLKAVMQAIAENPGIAPTVPDNDHFKSYVARWQNARQGHRIFFKEIDEGIYVFRILHTAMSWPLHLTPDT